MSKQRSLGQRIRLAREASGFSQEDVGDTVGVTRSSVSLWEQDYSLPEEDKLNRLADVLRVTPEYLTQGIGKAPKMAKTTELPYRRKMMTRFHRLIATGKFDSLLKDYVEEQITAGKYDAMLAKLGYRKARTLVK